MRADRERKKKRLVLWECLAVDAKAVGSSRAYERVHYLRLNFSLGSLRGSSLYHLADKFRGLPHELLVFFEGFLPLFQCPRHQSFLVLVHLVMELERKSVHVRHTVTVPSTMVMTVSGPSPFASKVNPCYRSLA